MPAPISLRISENSHSPLRKLARTLKPLEAGSFSLPPGVGGRIIGRERFTKPMETCDWGIENGQLRRDIREDQAAPTE